MITDEQIEIVTELLLDSDLCQEDVLKALEAYEQSKPKTEPVGYKFTSKRTGMFFIGSFENWEAWKIWEEQLNVVDDEHYVLAINKGVFMIDVPPCDICGKEVDYHIKHFTSEDDPHIHICDECVEQLGLKIYFLPTVDTLKTIREIKKD